MRPDKTPRLASVPFSIVRLACERCGRRTQFRRDALIRKYGAEITLPELLQKLTECPRQAGAEEACGMTYANLRSGISQKITPDHLDGLLGIPPTL